MSQILLPISWPSSHTKSLPWSCLRLCLVCEQLAGQQWYHEISSPDVHRLHCHGLRVLYCRTTYIYNDRRGDALEIRPIRLNVNNGINRLPGPSPIYLALPPHEVGTLRVWCYLSLNFILFWVHICKVVQQLKLNPTQDIKLSNETQILSFYSTSQAMKL